MVQFMWNERESLGKYWEKHWCFKSNEEFTWEGADIKVKMTLSKMLADVQSPWRKMMLQSGLVAGYELLPWDQILFAEGV